MKTIHYSDMTLQNSRMNLSFREKVETAKYLDRLQLDAIAVPAIENTQVDSLLIKSIAAAVSHAAICLPVALDEASVETAWDALQNAGRPCLQVVVPVSPVSMEYKAHMKPAAVRTLAETLVKKCKGLCDQVEFVAVDATRADKEFLKDMLAMAVENGATRITVTDIEGIMMPPEMHEFIAELRSMIPGEISLCVGLANTLGMADICAVEAVLAGADAIRVCVYGDGVDIQGVTRILTARQDKCQAAPQVKTTEMARNAAAIARMNTAASKGTPFESGVRDNETESIGEIGAGDNEAAVAKAVRKLGYELDENDMQAVYAAVMRVAAKKNVGARELDAIIANTAMQVPPTYVLNSFVITSGNTIGATARMEIVCAGETKTGVSMGDGPVDAAFLAIEQVVGHHYELDDFQIQAVTEGREAMGEALIRLRSDDGRLYSGRGISTDVIGASIRGYINALNKIVYEQ